MTRTISLIIGIAVSALALGVPVAFGEGRLAGSQPEAVAPDWFERAAIVAQQKASQPTIVSERTPESQWLRAQMVRSEGLNRMHGLGEFSTTGVSSYKDANERYVEPQSVTAQRLRSEGLNRMYSLGEFAQTSTTYKDSHERADVPTTNPVDVPVATSGGDVEWPQIGLGFGIGIALAIALGLSLKATRPRSLAH